MPRIACIGDGSPLKAAPPDGYFRRVSNKGLIGERLAQEWKAYLLPIDFQW